MVLLPERILWQLFMRFNLYWPNNFSNSTQNFSGFIYNVRHNESFQGHYEIFHTLIANISRVTTRMKVRKNWSSTTFFQFLHFRKQKPDISITVTKRLQRRSIFSGFSGNSRIFFDNFANTVSTSGNHTTVFFLTTTTAWCK